MKSPPVVPAELDIDDSKRRSPSFQRRAAAKQNLAVSACGLLVLGLFLSLRTVPAAHVGVAVTFGRPSANVLTSGIHVVNPLASVVLFSTKTTLLEQANHVPTKEGLTVDLDVAVLFHILPERARDIYLNLGEEFERVIIQPELSSAVRGLTSEADAKALYTSGRTEMQRKLIDRLAAFVASEGYAFEQLVLEREKQVRFEPVNASTPAVTGHHRTAPKQPLPTARNTGCGLRHGM